jgi:TonB family protein
MTIEASRSSGVVNGALQQFPKEFLRHPLENLDRRFTMILVASLVLHAAVVTYFVFNPPTHQARIEDVVDLERLYAERLLLEESRVELVEAVEGEPVESGEEGASAAEAESPPKRAAKPAPRRGGGGEPGALRGRGSRRENRERIRARAGSAGILALLGSDSEAASGAAVTDILGAAAGGAQDLDSALRGVSGIKSSGTPGRRGTGAADYKGGRAGGGGGIDDLLGGVGTAETGSFERTGDLVVSNEVPLIEDEGTGAGGAGRDPDDIYRVVENHKAAIQYCYNKELKRNPSLRGKMVIRITITPQGTVKSVKVLQNTLNNRRVERCVVSRIRNWNDFGVIDANYGDTTFTQTFVFGY